MHRTKNIAPLNRPVILLFVILFFATGFSAFSQKSDLDSIKIKKPVAVHSPRRATIYSAVLPGLGQIYNRKYWKVPIVYGGFATLGYFINFNNELYTKYKQAYSDIIDTDPNTNSFKKLNVNPIFFEADKISQLTERLRLAKDGSRRNRDLVVIGTAVFYALNIIDANVDAALIQFNVDENLSVRPIIYPNDVTFKTNVGLTINYNF